MNDGHKNTTKGGNELMTIFGFVFDLNLLLSCTI